MLLLILCCNNRLFIDYQLFTLFLTVICNNHSNIYLVRLYY